MAMQFYISTNELTSNTTKNLMFYLITKSKTTHITKPRNRSKIKIHKTFKKRKRRKAKK